MGAAVSITFRHTMTRLTSFHARNFRTLRDVSVDELPGVVLLYGTNDVGKSNLVLALQYWLQLLSEIGPEGLYQSPRSKSVEPEFHGEVFSQVTHGESKMELGGRLLLSGQAFEFHVQVTADEVRVLKAMWPSSSMDAPISQHETRILAEFLRDCWVLADAERRFAREYLTSHNQDAEIDPCGSNLKQHLFFTAHSKKPAIRNRFQEFCARVRVGPFAALPSPILALDGSQIELLMDSSRVEDCGAGFRQWAAACAMLTASGARFAAVEEPEVHLSWEGQRGVFWALRKFQEAGSPHQLFLTTHSPVALVASSDGTWFEVQRGPNGTTIHRRHSRERLAVLFPELAEAPLDDRVLHLMQGGYVRLSEQALKHLDVKPEEHLYCALQTSPVRSVALVSIDEMGRYLEP